MAKEDVGKFYEELVKNKDLQEKLKKAQDGYDGDKNDRDEVAEKILIPVAKEAGYEFTISDMCLYEKEQLVKQGVSEEELENITGGKSDGGFCAVIGCCSGFDLGICIIWGGVASDMTEGMVGIGAYLCWNVGIGLGGNCHEREAVL